MNLRKLLYILPLFLFIAHLSAKAQRDSIALTSIVDKTQKFTSGHPIEKVFLHFDKPYYAVGDTIWVKAYLTVDLHVPSPLSKIVYIDFINDQRVMVTQLKLQVVNGTANSYLPLKAPDFKEGNYRIRAYTRWMRNSDDAYFFNKTITVASAQKGQVKPRVSFQNSITEKTSKIDAAIVYKDQDGVPYANKKVSWKAMSDDDVLARGKGETDANGKLNVSFTTEKSQELNSANINTEIEIEDKKNVTKIFPIETQALGIDMQFFPEGGYLITGVRSRVAFKAIKPDGYGIESKGTITDNTGAVVAEFASQHLGMGVFALLSEAGKTYKANVTYADGTHDSIDLPTPRDEGINLSLNNVNPDTLIIKIATDQSYFDKNKNRTFYVMAQSNGIVCFAAQTSLRSMIYSAGIPKSKFPTGIVQVTLFSAKGSQLSERVAFIRHNDLMNLSLKSDKSTYSRKEQVKMQVTAKNGATPAEGNFSVSVVDEALVPYNEDDETTILSHLLLTSDLRGFIEKPNYYFNHHDSEAEANLDILMLTQGYRRFSYRNIIADKPSPMKFFPESGIDITGSLRTNTGLPVAKGSVRLLIPDKAFSTQVVTDMSGNFRFANVLLSDSSKVTLTARDNPGGSNMVLKIDPFTQAPTSQFVNPVGMVANLDSAAKTYLANSVKQQNALNKPHVLAEVKITDHAAPTRVTHQDFPALTGLPVIADHEVDGKQFAGCNAFLQCLMGQAVGLTYDNNNFYITRDYNSPNSARIPVAIYVNGSPVDFAYLQNVDANTVESIEIFNSDGFAGINRTSGTKGVLEVNLKKQPKGEKISKEQLMDMLPKPYEATFSPGGYNYTRLFYSPKYPDPEKATAIVDYRSTIYWSPAVVTDKTGTASFEFYNADGTGPYRAIIQGIDKDGNLGWTVYHYQVR